MIKSAKSTIKSTTVLNLIINIELALLRYLMLSSSTQNNQHFPKLVRRHDSCDFLFSKML